MVVMFAVYLIITVVGLWRWRPNGNEQPLAHGIHRAAGKDKNMTPEEIAAVVEDLVVGHIAKKLSPDTQDVFRRAWRSYLNAAQYCGVLDADVEGRMRGDNTACWSAVAECMACWYFKEKLAPLGFSVEAAKPSVRTFSQRDGTARESVPDMQIRLPGARVAYVEVKSTWPTVRHVQLGMVDSVIGDVVKKVKGCLDAACRQLPSGHPNIVFIVPPAVPFLRDALVTALVGKQELGRTINIETGELGQLERVIHDTGAMVKLIQGKRPYTRVGAIVCVVENPLAPSGMGYEELVVHNPFAACPLAEDIWGAIPQFLARRYYNWSDGKNL